MNPALFPCSCRSPRVLPPPGRHKWRSRPPGTLAACLALSHAARFARCAPSARCAPGPLAERFFRAFRVVGFRVRPLAKRSAAPPWTAAAAPRAPSRGSPGA